MKHRTHPLAPLFVLLTFLVATGCADHLTGTERTSAAGDVDAFVVSQSAAKAALAQAPVHVSGNDNRVRLEVGLNATDADPLASGKAKFESRTDRDRSRFSTEVEDVSLDGDGEVVVSRDGVEVLRATIMIANGFGDLNMDSRRDDVPAMLEGDLVEVFNADGVLILSATLVPKN
ncbi:hypothetical protein [Rhodocaloribacter sp.]